MVTRREVRRAVYDMEWTMWKRNSRFIAVRKLFRLAWWEKITVMRSLWIFLLVGWRERYCCGGLDG
jgi:hypothetical protein